MTDTPAVSSPKELLWLACRDKTCCHNTKVIISGLDLWRISRALELAPWDYTRYAEAITDAVDAFQLEAGGPAYQMVLAKRGEVGPRGAPCIFLWKLADGHAQCGLGALRPLVCLTYPATLRDGLLSTDSGACTCRRWSVGDLDAEEEVTRLGQMLTEAAEYAEVVAAWNADLATASGPRSYQDFCTYVLDAYKRRYEIPA